MKPIAVFLFAAVFPAVGQPSLPSCLRAEDFTATEIFNRAGTLGSLAPADTSIREPVQFALHPVKRDGLLSHVDIWFVQRHGAVQYFDGEKRVVKTAGRIRNWAAIETGSNDNGLMGIALHPAFDENRWMFLWYIPPVADKVNEYRRLRLARFTVGADNTLDMASEKILVDIQGSKHDKYHGGGPMAFDAYGDLWVQIGNNSDNVVGAEGVPPYHQFDRKDSSHSEEWGPSNTASMRGGTIRIHPDGSEKGYSIPAGNFGEYWASEFERQGRTALAAQYRDPARVLPELYVKGDRSNYSIALHPVKRWMGWGSINYSDVYDELNLAGHPVFGGFPYFHAGNTPVPGLKEVIEGMDPQKPINDSPFRGNGVRELPPAMPGAANNLENSAIGGPFYLYDPGSPSRTKFPPHLHNRWFVFNFMLGRMQILTLDTNSLKVTGKARVDTGVFKGLKLRRPLQAAFGPDGSLYVLNYDGFYTTGNPGITRVDYNPEGACPIPIAVRDPGRALRGFAISLSSARLRIDEPGAHEVTLHDLGGRQVASLRGKQGAEYAFTRIREEFRLGGNVHFVRIRTARGVFRSSVSFLQP